MDLIFFCPYVIHLYLKFDYRSRCCATARYHSMVSIFLFIMGLLIWCCLALRALPGSAWESCRAAELLEVPTVTQAMADVRAHRGLNALMKRQMTMPLVSEVRLPVRRMLAISHMLSMFQIWTEGVPTFSPYLKMVNDGDTMCYFVVLYPASLQLSIISRL